MLSAPRAAAGFRLSAARGIRSCSGPVGVRRGGWLRSVGRHRTAVRALRGAVPAPGTGGAEPCGRRGDQSSGLSGCPVPRPAGPQDGHAPSPPAVPPPEPRKAARRPYPDPTGCPTSRAPRGRKATVPRSASAPWSRFRAVPEGRSRRPETAASSPAVPRGGPGAVRSAVPGAGRTGLGTAGARETRERARPRTATAVAGTATAAASRAEKPGLRGRGPAMLPPQGVRRRWRPSVRPRRRRPSPSAPRSSSPLRSGSRRSSTRGRS